MGLASSRGLHRSGGLGQPRALDPAPRRVCLCRGRWAVEGRWSKSFERLSADCRDLLSLGLLWLGPFQQSSGVVGLGELMGERSDPALGHESGGELFWRLQLTQSVNLMPDVQY